MVPARIAAALLAANLSVLPIAGAATAMTASTFDGSRRVVIIAAETSDDERVREQRAALLKHTAALDERDMVVFVSLRDGEVEPIHRPAPADIGDFLSRNPPAKAGGFEVLLVGKDGGVKLRSDRPVRAEDLFALIDTMPMRRQEMTR